MGYNPKSLLIGILLVIAVPYFILSSHINIIIKIAVLLFYLIYLFK